MTLPPELLKDYIIEAPEDLVEPTQEVVVAAMAKVVESIQTPPDPNIPVRPHATMHITFVYYEPTNRLYALTAIGGFQQMADGLPWLQPVGDTTIGLTITGFQLNKGNEHISLSPLHLPRESIGVTKQRLHPIRDTHPQAMRILATELREGTIISQYQHNRRLLQPVTNE